jgi:hypothetical protein
MARPSYKVRDGSKDGRRCHRTDPLKPTLKAFNARLKALDAAVSAAHHSAMYLADLSLDVPKAHINTGEGW